jgi:hypothetical protein
MSNYSNYGYKPYDPCQSQLYKTVKYRYYRFPTKYICTPVEWGTKCEKHVVWEPVKPYPPVKVPCEHLKQPYYGKEQPYYDKEQPYYGKEQPYDDKEQPYYPTPGCCGYAQDGSYYEADGYAQDYQGEEENGGYADFEYPDK